MKKKADSLVVRPKAGELARNGAIFTRGLELAQAALSLPPGLEPLGRNEFGYEEFRNIKDGSVLIRVPGGTFPIGMRDEDARLILALTEQEQEKETAGMFFRDRLSPLLPFLAHAR